MLTKTVDINEGDCIIQNAANSALGLLVIQMAKARGIKTINVIRSRSNLKEAVERLEKLGATLVVTAEDLNQQGLKKLLPEGMAMPKLALDAVGGSSTNDLVSSLAPGGTLCNYGLLSGKPCEVGAADLIFRGIKVTGFWLTRFI